MESRTRLVLESETREIKNKIMQNWNKTASGAKPTVSVPINTKAIFESKQSEPASVTLYGNKIILLVHGTAGGAEIHSGKKGSCIHHTEKDEEKSAGRG